MHAGGIRPQRFVDEFLADSGKLDDLIEKLRLTYCRTLGVEFIGIDVRDDPASAQAFMAKFHITFPSVNDPSNMLALRFRGVPPSATPTTVVIDRAGRIAARQIGEIYYTQLRDVVNHVLSEPV